MTVTIYHNPACGTSRNTLAMIRATGIEPLVIEYLVDPPSKERLVELMSRAGLTARELVRTKGTPFEELGLADPSVTDAELVDAMVEHPVLINRPLVETSKGVKLCRPSEDVLSLLDRPLPSDFTKEDGEVVRASYGHGTAP